MKLALKKSLMKFGTCLLRGDYVTFKIGGYVKHKEYPKSKVVICLTSDTHVQVINAQAENFKHANEKEIAEYHRKWKEVNK